MSYLAIVPQFHIEDVWIKVLPYFLNGEDRWNTFYTLEEIKKNLIYGKQQLWIMVDGNDVIGAVMTQIDDFPKTKSLRVLFLGGKGFKRSMIKEMKKIESWAKSKGCTVVDFLGREEWYSLLKMMGYSSPGRVYRKEF